MYKRQLRICEQVLVNKRSRENAEKTRLNLKKKLSGSIDLANRVQKFVDCRSKMCIRDSYNAVFEDKFMQQIIQNRLDILDTIRKIEISDRVPCTLSIGIGREAPSISEADEMARQALEMAQGRGGDQAAVRTKNGYDFYGGLRCV